ncbi:epoxide hydrolase family protein [uncultured Devosia sp.]|uniref:epoxide hydrolase family protein n=1 Tax=uncultured Devosia sp. TaxID=211434 RepID=UPI0035CBCB02
MIPFQIAVDETTLEDLKVRLADTRLPQTLDDVGWDYGIEAGFVRRLVSYWGNQFDWRAAETRLNGFSQFTDEIDGETIHFVHVKGEGERSVPLLLTNGWPSNFVELMPIVPLLTRQVEGVSFDVVIPSLPGYGFSGKPSRPGMNLSRIAPLWAQLMSRLGYERFLVSGSDLGAGVEMVLVKTAPERIIGAHYSNVYWGFARPDEPTPEEAEYFAATDYWSFAEGAYAMIQGTKPATLAVGLNDSPGGLAAWIAEKFHGWNQKDRPLETAFKLDDLCTILSVYWFSQSIGSSVRLYKEAFADRDLIKPGPPHRVPHGIYLAPGDQPAPRAWGERHLQNIVRWTPAEAGGHFPALEFPEAFAADIRAFHAQIK